MDTTIITRTQASAQQLLRYFTGVPCKNNHTVERSTKTGMCMQCQRDNGVRFRNDRPDVMKKWRENNPGYASAKYHENAEERKVQTKEWYEANKERVLQARKEWYYADGMAEKLAISRQTWYDNNPTYDEEYRVRNKTRLLEQAKLRHPKRWAEYKARVQAAFADLVVDYILPDNPTEHDFKYWLAGEIIKRTGWVVNKEVWLDDAKSSRIDLLIPEAKIGLELKLSNKYCSPTKVGMQQQRYQALLEQDGYAVTVVSLDGTLGISAEDFLKTLPQLL